MVSQVPHASLSKFEIELSVYFHLRDPSLSPDIQFCPRTDDGRDDRSRKSLNCTDLQKISREILALKKCFCSQNFAGEWCLRFKAFNKGSILFSVFIIIDLSVLFKMCTFRKICHLNYLLKKKKVRINHVDLDLSETIGGKHMGELGSH